MSDVLIITTPNGHLSLRSRNFIQYAPTGTRITVKQMDDKIGGCSIDSAIIDDPLAKLKGEE